MFEALKINFKIGIKWSANEVCFALKSDTLIRL